MPVGKFFQKVVWLTTFFGYFSDKLKEKQEESSCVFSIFSKRSRLLPRKKRFV